MIRKTAIIIGASSEIGLETAKVMAKSGYNLALTYNTNKVDFQNELIQNESFRLSLEQILSSDKYENLKIKFESLRKIIEDINNEDTNKDKKDGSQ